MVGITERGDAALDRSWAEKQHLVAGLILITKRCDKDETWAMEEKNRSPSDKAGRD